MNGKKVKLLRKKIYGDLSLRSEEIRKQEKVNGTVINIGLRKDYQEAKKQ